MNMRRLCVCHNMATPNGTHNICANFRSSQDTQRFRQCAPINKTIGIVHNAAMTPLKPTVDECSISSSPRETHRTTWNTVCSKTITAIMYPNRSCRWCRSDNGMNTFRTDMASLAFMVWHLVRNTAPNAGYMKYAESLAPPMSTISSRPSEHIVSLGQNVTLLELQLKFVSPIHCVLPKTQPSFGSSTRPE